MSTEKTQRAWVEVSASALRQNLQRVQAAVGPRVRMLPMVKADAYGLGVAGVVAALEPLDPWGYGVGTVEEGRGLRRFGVQKPVLVCSPLSTTEYRGAIDANLTVSISDLQGLTALREAGEGGAVPGRFHIEVDTGMGRAGFGWREVGDWARKIAALSEDVLLWEGCFTHFHSADDGDVDPTSTQGRRFLSTVEKIPGKPDNLVLHACNSAGALRLPDLGLDVVRPGIFLYGGVAGKELPTPTPVVSLKARIVHKKEVPPGSTVGYGSTYASSGIEQWATVGIGYGDGLPRLLSNRGQALVAGRRTPIIGRISMDLTVLDVSWAPAADVGDVVTFFGRGAGGEIPLEEVAGHAETINYEILTGLSKRLPRIWKDDAGY